MTRFAAIDVPLDDPAGRPIVLVVVKGTFDPAGEPLTPPAPIWTADVPWDPEAEGESSLRWPSDLALAKPMADVVVVGAARPPRPTRVHDVVVRVGERRAHLRVHGERLFYRGAGGRIAIAEAAPFVDKPLVYERAFGGRGEAVVERRNPVGRGVADRVEDLIDTPAPQIEWADDPVTGPGGRHEPAGLGAIPAHWMPRAGYAGTFDERWERERMPRMPPDFDPRFHCAAHPRLQLEGVIAPGTPLGVDGMTPEGPLPLTVPALAVRIVALFDDGSREEVTPGVDTAVIDTEARRTMLSCRAVFPRGRGRRRLRALRVEEK